MKLQTAQIFGEHMVIQQGKPVPVWGRCAADDVITVKLNDTEVQAESVRGTWKAVLPPVSAGTGMKMTVTSALTGEQIIFHDVAAGEVWLAGGQSNMEFIMKYDVNAEAMKKTEEDKDLRFFCAPQVPFMGYEDKETCPDHGFWRQWDTEKNRIMFSAVGAYMGRYLRRELNVPVGIIGCNWGGTPASAWTDMQDIESHPELAPVLEEYRHNCEAIDWRRYIETSERPIPEPTPEQLAFTDRFMMGEDMTEFFRNMENMPRPDISDWGTYPIAPRSATRPGGVYETMLKKIAPYAVQGVIWYQGEDDDARGWSAFYDKSMETMIGSWRKLWQEELPFLQVELAPFRGVGVPGAKDYPGMRRRQHSVSETVKDVHDICILDLGEEFNIHPRRKQKVGERLARTALRYVYGREDVQMTFPQAYRAERDGDILTVYFRNTGKGLYVSGDLTKELKVYSNDTELAYRPEIHEDSLVLHGDFHVHEKLTVTFCDTNYCEDPLYGSEGDPAYAFTFADLKEKDR